MKSATRTKRPLLLYGSIICLISGLGIWASQAAHRPNVSSPTSHVTAAKVIPLKPVKLITPAPAKSLSRAERRKLRREQRKLQREAARLAKAKQAAAAHSSIAAPSLPPDLKSTPEYELASFQKPGIAHTDPLVHDFAVQLDRMEAKRDKRYDGPFSNREGLVHVTLECHNLMSEKGVDEDCLTILTHVNNSVPEDVQSGKGAIDLFAAYAASRTRH